MLLYKFKHFLSRKTVQRFLSTMKIDTPQFHAILTDEVKILEKLFVENGHEIRIAGGAVRDLLLGIQPKDVDFATTATPNEMKEMFAKNEVRMINSAGEKHGTITPRINDKENFEVTTLRVDVVTDGRRAEVEFVKDWKLDANRRDLTINSMFLGLDGILYDYFNGLEDLKKRRVVFVGDARTRIQEDYLRILRYFRFYGRIAEKADQHDEETLEAVRENRAGLDRISGERIWSELHKTVEGNFGSDLLRLMVKLDLGPHVGLPDEVDFAEYEAVASRATKKDLRAISLICGLLRSTDDLLAFTKRCRPPNFDRDLGLFLIANRDDKPHEQPLRPYQILVMTSTNKPTDVRQFIEQVLLYRGATDLLKEFRQWELPAFPVNGNMVRTAVEVTSGPQVGGILRSLKQIWAESDFTLTKEELLQLAPSLMRKNSAKKMKKE